MAKASVYSLPNELLLKIVERLPFSSLIKLRNVSRKWRAVVAVAHVDSACRSLLNVYSCVTTAPFIRRHKPTLGKKLTDADRTRYWQSINGIPNCSSTRDARHVLSETVFLLWLFEWPANAAICGMSPASVVFSFLNERAYDSVTATALSKILVYYPWRRLVFTTTLTLDIVVLNRIPLSRLRDANTLYCNGLSSVNMHFDNDIWGRFLPIFVSDTPTIDWIGKRVDSHTVPMFVFSSMGVGAELSGGVVSVSKNGRVNILAESWAEYLLRLCTDELNEYRKQDRERFRKRLEDLDIARGAALVALQDTDIAVEEEDAASDAFMATQRGRSGTESVPRFGGLGQDTGDGGRLFNNSVVTREDRNYDIQWLYARRGRDLLFQNSAGCMTDGLNLIWWFCFGFFVLIVLYLLGY